MEIRFFFYNVGGARRGVEGGRDSWEAWGSTVLTRSNTQPIEAYNGIRAALSPRNLKKKRPTEATSPLENTSDSRAHGWEVRAPYRRRYGKKDSDATPDRGEATLQAYMKHTYYKAEP